MDINEIIKDINAVPLRCGLRIIAIAGGPASGKSTLAERLAECIPNACAVPMDGFHHDNNYLIEKGRLATKGAPDTFDAEAFVTFIRSIRMNGAATFPTFDRTNDCVIPAGGRISSTAQTILVEGNYLLLNSKPWSALSTEWDLTVMVDAPLAVLRARLVERWMENGHDPASALTRANMNDIPNAKYIMAHSRSADLVVTST